MDETLIVAISVLLQVAAVLTQLTAAFFALRLIRVTGRSRAWVLVSAGFCIMAVRRSISVARMLAGDPSNPADLLDDSMALAISGVMLAGVLVHSPPVSHHQTGRRSPATDQRGPGKQGGGAHRRIARRQCPTVGGTGRAAPGRTQAGPIRRRPGPLQCRAGAVRLRGLPRLAGTPAHGGQLHATSGQTLPGQTGSGRRRIHRLCGGRGHPHAAAHQRPAGLLPGGHPGQAPGSHGLERGSEPCRGQSPSRPSRRAGRW